MLSRRLFLTGSVGVALGLPRGRTASAQAVLTEDGLYREPWFLESFLELADDLEGAAEKSRRFAIVWELRGCPYCRETHLVNFAKPEIADFVKARFDILQLNIIGAREVVDLRRREADREGVGRKIWRSFHPYVPVFS